MRSFFLRACAALLLALPLAPWAQDGPQKLAAIRLAAGMHNIQAEVASTPEQRTIGLMFRETLGTNDGMLFVFEQPATQCFWMRNTFVPLSAAFLADDGTIVNIADMTPRALDSHCSARPVRYVLEMNQGWFARRGIKPGFRLKGGPFGS